MKLYVCWGVGNAPGGRKVHECANAFEALKEAGHRPEIIPVKGSARLPKPFRIMTAGRREVERISGQAKVPVLVTDADEVIVNSHAIADWAREHPA